MEKFLDTKYLTDQKFLLENFLFSIGPLTALIAIRFGPRAWIKYEMAIGLVFGLVLAFKPEPFFSLVLNSPIKPFHQFLSAACGVYLINTILIPFFVLNSQDESIFYGHYYARIIEHTLIIIDNAVAYNEGVHWNYKYLCLMTSQAIIHLAINIYLLARTPKPSGQNPFKDLANSIGKIDFYILLVYGIYVYAFPDRINLTLGGPGTTNESYRSLTRSGGALIISTSLYSFCMSEFKFIRDKKNFLLARFLSSVNELAVFFSGYYCFRVFSLETFASWLVTSILYKLLILYGYINTPHEHLKAH